MHSIVQRPRRLRATPAIRELVAESSLEPRHLIQPLFVKEGTSTPTPIPSMPGVFQHTVASMRSILDELVDAGVKSVMLFGVPSERDAVGSAACDPEGILNVAVSAARTHVGDSLVIIADLCLDEFTIDGHCGVVDGSGIVDNDATLDHYCAMAVALAKAGAHMVGTSGMMDGQVGAIRSALDEQGYTNVGILAYAAKYASAFYGPFRDAVESTLTGDRLAYQQDPRNRRESMREIALDCEQGADIVMVKPALSYLDVVREAADSTTIPIAAYVVSGEMTMVELAAAHGLIDRDRAIAEILHSVRRAGAHLVCTYWALEYSRTVTRKVQP